MDATKFTATLSRVIDSAITISDDLAMDAINAAEIAIMPYVQKVVVALLAGDGVEIAFDLPEDCYQIISILDEETSWFLPRATMEAYTHPGGSNIEINNDWLDYPDGSITFTNPPSGIARVTYGAYWTEITAMNNVLTPPRWAVNAMVFYAAHYVFTSAAAGSSDMAQFKQKVDSGNPVQNPHKEIADYYHKLFINAIERHPHTIKGVQ